jgi:5-deoxy-D-glucuronate isomerase
MDCVAHPDHSGTMVEAPCGYHPTVASPGTRNAYFWALASFLRSSAATTSRSSTRSMQEAIEFA